MGEKRQKVMIALYIFFILWITLFTREPRAARIVKGLFWEIRMGYWWDITLNILLFIPLGFLLAERVGKLFCLVSCYLLLLSVLSTYFSWAIAKQMMC